MRFAICNELFEKWPFDRVCDVTREIGYTGLEVAPFTLAPRAEQVTADHRRQLRAAAEQRGLQILGLHWLLVGPSGLYMTHPVAAVRQATSAYFRELINLCADLGGNVLIIGSPKQRNLLPGVSREQAMGFARDVFGPCLDPAASRRVTLAFEPLGPAETNFIQTVGEAIELIEQLNHPAFRLNIDVKAMSSESKPIPDVIRQAAPYIAHMQVNDPNLKGPGMGDVKYEPIIAALREIGYDGWLSVEAFDFSPGPETIARQSIEYLKQVTAKRP
jgi:sugar phosphate isomerase/epimerase